MNDPSPQADIVFMTHATAVTGFGHAARCARLARLIHDAMPDADLVFDGTFSPSARGLIEQGNSLRFGHVGSARVGVYDRMDDTERPEVWSRSGLERFRQTCRHVVFMANGHEDPQVPEGVTVIGYKPGGPAPRPPYLLWGLEFAPCMVSVPEATVAREPETALVALGGAQGDAGILKAIRALTRVQRIRRVEVLESPANPFDVPDGIVRADQTLVRHSRLPELCGVLSRVGVVVASYGHLGYEALACGAPLCLVGQKWFQADYAAGLADHGLCVAAGLLGSLSEDALASAIEVTLDNASALSSAAQVAVDGRGLRRIASIVIEKSGMAA